MYKRQLQEGPALTGYTPHTEPFLKKLRVDGEVKAPVWFNGVVRGEETVILFNLGETSAGLDVHLYPKSDLEARAVSLCQGVGGQKVSFPNAVPAEADLALLASTRQCTKNGSPEKKEGFYQYLSLIHIYYGMAHLSLSQDEVWLMPFGLLMDLWECHKQFMGIAKPKQMLTIDDVIPYGI